MKFKDLTLGMLRFEGTYRWHIIAWSIYIIYEIFLVNLFPKSMRVYPNNYLTYYSINISLFYINGLWILPNVFSKPVQALWKLPLFLTAELTACFGLLIAQGVISGTIEIDTNSNEFVLNISGFEYFIIPFIPYLLYSTGYYFLRRYLKHQQENQRRENIHLEKIIENHQLKNNLLKAEKSLLRAQINPHLLYNTLNFITYSAKKKPEEADEAIQLLASIMRYIFDEIDGNDLYPLLKEIEQAKNVIQLNQLRFSHKLFVQLSVSDEVKSLQTIPLLLLTLVENIFKHGEVKNPRYPAKINIALKSDMLLFETINLSAVTHSGQDRSGKGLANIAQSLSVYFPNSHLIKFGLVGNLFKTEIGLPIYLKDQEFVLCDK